MDWPTQQNALVTGMLNDRSAASVLSNPTVCRFIFHRSVTFPISHHKITADSKFGAGAGDLIACSLADYEIPDAVCRLLVEVIGFRRSYGEQTNCETLRMAQCDPAARRINRGENSG
jgi:hypothetical protein